MKIADNVFLVPGVVANPFLVLHADGLTLIDAGLLNVDRGIADWPDVLREMTD